LIAENLITAYWGNRGLDALLTADQAHAAELDQGTLAGALAIVLVHTGLLIVAAFVALSLQGRRTPLLADLMSRGGQRHPVKVP
jgi:hypothetical protein